MHPVDSFEGHFICEHVHYRWNPNGILNVDFASIFGNVVPFRTLGKTNKQKCYTSCVGSPYWKNILKNSWIWNMDMAFPSVVASLCTA